MRSICEITFPLEAGHLLEVFGHCAASPGTPAVRRQCTAHRISMFWCWYIARTLYGMATTNCNRPVYVPTCQGERQGKW
jgi:hypothetical protein